MSCGNGRQVRQAQKNYNCVYENSYINLQNHFGALGGQFCNLFKTVERQTPVSL